MTALGNIAVILIVCVTVIAALAAIGHIPA
jgi:hypothetical protein